MLKNRSGEIVVDQNIKIAIAVISLIVILTGVVFFFGDKVNSVLSNFLPEYNTPVGDQEIVLTGTDSNVNYASSLIDIGQQDPAAKTTSEEQNGFLSKDYGEFYQNIVANFLVLSFLRDGNEIIKMKSFSEEKIDPDSKTNPVRILFSKGNDNYVDFIYDGQRKEALFGNSNTGLVFGKEIFAAISDILKIIYSKSRKI